MNKRLRSIRTGAFTLIELMTVIAITAIIMTIIMVPMIQSFNTVRSAQAFADAQEKARLVLERISREISNSAAVRDNSGTAGTCDVVVPGYDGTLVSVPLQYTKLDICLPAQEGPVDPSGNPVNPGTGKTDPTLHGQKGQVLLPVAPGATIVRYWIGLRAPLVAPTSSSGWEAGTYNNPYDGLLMARNGNRDNLYVLLRAEVQPYIVVGGVRQVNTQFFDVDSNGNPILDDPAFYVYNPATDSTAKRIRISNWQNRATIVTEVSRYDMITPIYDMASRKVQYDNLAGYSTGVPRILPLIQFVPSRVGSESAGGMESVRLGNEADNMEQFAPDVFKTKLGGLSDTIVRIYPVGWTGGSPYLIARPDTAPAASNITAGDLVIFYYDPTSGYDDLNPNGTETEMFDVTRYENDVAAGGVFSFSDALPVGANLTSAQLAAFIPFALDSTHGKITASFGNWEIGTNPPNPPSGDSNNLPMKVSGTQLQLGSNNPPDTSGSLSSYANEINDQYDKVWTTYTTLQGNVQRFIDLRVTTQGDGSPSPLYLNTSTPTGYPRASIVPGSEVVYGPDQRPENVGRTDSSGNPIIVRYSRTTGSPGVNQYRINYVDLPEPTNSSGLIDYSLLGVPNPPAPWSPSNPPTYDPNSLVLAIIQPRYKAGYIQLNSDATSPLPTGTFTVQYRVQFTKQTVQSDITASGTELTKQTDSLTVDYSSRQVMSVLFTVKNYPQTSDPNPQGITLKATANVRNFLR
jgi:type II secretory pathway pseudopilin PulG